jgi:hypothetical protein
MRGLTLIEVMISQAIAIIVISAMMAVVVAMVNKLQSEVAISDAQVHLRQVSHLLLRDTQGVGASSGSSAGDFISIADGGANGADSFTLFRRDESICGGGIALDQKIGKNNKPETHDGVNLNPDQGDGCPIGRETCGPDELNGRSLFVTGKTGSAMMVGHNAREQACKITYPTGKQASDIVDRYNASTGLNASNISNMFDLMLPAQILAGSAFTYQLDSARNVLQRSTDGGETFIDILDGVFDLQVQRVFQTPGEPVFVSEGEALPADVEADDFIGLRIGLVTFGRAVDGLTVPPPPVFANRNLSAAPKNRRYRASFVVTAARNRGGS